MDLNVELRQREHRVGVHSAQPFVLPTAQDGARGLGGGDDAHQEQEREAQAAKERREERRQVFEQRRQAVIDQILFHQEAERFSEEQAAACGRVRWFLRPDLDAVTRHFQAAAVHRSQLHQAQRELAELQAEEARAVTEDFKARATAFDKSHDHAHEALRYFGTKEAVRDPRIDKCENLAGVAYDLARSVDCAAIDHRRGVAQALGSHAGIMAKLDARIVALEQDERTQLNQRLDAVEKLATRIGMHKAEGAVVLALRRDHDRRLGAIESRLDVAEHRLTTVLCRVNGDKDSHDSLRARVSAIEQRLATLEDIKRS